MDHDIKTSGSDLFVQGALPSLLLLGGHCAIFWGSAPTRSTASMHAHLVERICLWPLWLSLFYCDRFSRSFLFGSSFGSFLQAIISSKIAAARAVYLHRERMAAPFLYKMKGVGAQRTDSAKAMAEPT